MAGTLGHTMGHATGHTMVKFVLTGTAIPVSEREEGRV